MPNLIQFQRGSFYHIYNRGNNRETIFRSDENYRFFLKRYIQHVSPVATTYAYCLMPNHFHMLIYLLTEEEQRDRLDAIPPEWQPMAASRAFAKLFTSYAMAFNKMWGRTGSLFTKSLARKRVSDDAYFTQLVRYIHRNPQNRNTALSMIFVSGNGRPTRPSSPLNPAAFRVTNSSNGSAAVTNSQTHTMLLSMTTSSNPSS